MENKTYALIVGCFVIVMSLAILVVLWWFSSQHTPMRSIQFITEDQVNGLSIGAQVRYHGVVVGNVSHISLDAKNLDKITVQAEVKNDLPLSDQMRASLNYQGITGMAYIEMDNAKDAQLISISADKPMIIPLEKGTLQRFSNKTEILLNDFHTTLKSLSQIVDQDNLKSFKAILKNLASGSQNIDHSFAKMTQTMEKLDLFLSSENMNNLNRVLALSPQLVEQLLGNLKQINDLTFGLHQSVQAKLVPELEQTLTLINQNSESLNQLLEQINRNPQVLFSGPNPIPAGPSEQGFSQQRSLVNP